MSEEKLSLSSIGEFGLIKHLISPHTKNLPHGIVGAGDDCAVVPLSYFGTDLCSSRLVVTTDLMVEDRHFRLSYFSPYDLGWKLMAVNISDIAAMGAEPLFAVIGMQLRRDIDVEFTEELYRGLLEHAQCYNIRLVGGDASSGSELSLGLTLLGRLDGDPFLRNGAKAGDDLWVSGDLGAANLALRLLEKEPGFSVGVKDRERLLARFLRPEPRIKLSRFLKQERLCNAMLDVSDGLLQDAAHIAIASVLDIEIDVQLVPCSVAGQIVSAISGGEDYELLFSCSAEQSAKLEELRTKCNWLDTMPALTRIGTLKRPSAELGQVFIKEQQGNILEAGRYLFTLNPSARAGFSHF